MPTYVTLAQKSSFPTLVPPVEVERLLALLTPTQRTAVWAALVRPDDLTSLTERQLEKIERLILRNAKAGVYRDWVRGEKIKQILE